MIFPVAEKGLKIVLSISFGGIRWRTRFYRLEILLHGQLVCFIAYARLICNPIDLPGLSTIGREGLFRVSRGRSDIRPDHPHKKSLAVKCVLAQKLTASISEFADVGRIQDAGLAAGPIEPPLVRFGIV